MARTKQTAKTSRENFDEYVKKNSGVGFTKFSNIDVNLEEGTAGVGCCVSLSGDCHILMMAPDSERLEEALKELGIKKRERSAADVSMIALYPAELSKIIEENEESAKKVFWIIDSAKYAQMVYGLALKYHNNSKVLGEAQRCTKLECKLLLRGMGWDRDRIESVIFDEEHPFKKIPF